MTSYPVIELAEHYRHLDSVAKRKLLNQVSAIAQQRTYGMLVFDKQRDSYSHVFYWREPISERKIEVVAVLLSEFMSRVRTVDKLKGSDYFVSVQQVLEVTG